MSVLRLRAVSSSRLTSLAGGALLVLLAVACQRSRQEPQVAAAPPPPPQEEQAAQAPAQPAPQEQVAPAPAPPAAPAPIVLRDVGFKTPECVLYDAEEDVYLVSNINGAPTETNDTGFISKVAPDGKVLELKWIDGASADVTLNAPKGMAIAGDKLYVADITFVRVFDRKTGKPLGKIGAAGATFLNGVAAAPDGTIYVSDSGMKAGKDGFEPTGSDAILRIGTRGTAEPVLKDKSLNGPNGVVADANGVWVVTFSGKELYRVAISGNEGKKEQVQELPSGGLDGLVALPDGSLLVSSWESSTVYRGKPGGTFTPVAKDVKSPAAIGYDTKRSALLIPLFQEDAVVIQALGAAPAEPSSSGAAAPAQQEPAPAQPAATAPKEAASPQPAAPPPAAPPPAAPQPAAPQPAAPSGEQKAAASPATTSPAAPAPSAPSSSAAATPAPAAPPAAKK